MAQSGQTSLKEILRSIEEKYNVVFSYKDENIIETKIYPPNDSLVLEGVIKYLELTTDLKFEQLNERFIVINRVLPPTKKFCGIVKDITGETLPGAVIRFGEHFTVSDEEGRFELEGLPENSLVSVMFFGHQTRILPVSELGSEECPVISLAFDITQLDELIVNDFITEGISKKLDGSFVINTDQLNILPGLSEPDVLKSLQVLPGIQSVNETVSNLNVRGGTNDQNLVLWEGIKMYQTGHFFGLISAFNPFVIKKATLIKNGTSAAFSEGTSSTIQIESDDSVSDQIQGGGGINLLSADVFFKIPIAHKTLLQVSARRSISDLAETPTYNQYFDRAFRYSDVVTDLFTPDSTRITSDEKFRFNDVSAKLVHDFGTKSRLRLNFINIENRIQYNENAILNSSPESKTSRLDQNSIASGVHFDRKWGDKFRTSAQLYLSSYRLRSTNFDILNDQQVIQENKVLDTGIKLDAHFELSKNMALHGGYQFFEIGISDLQDINNPRFEAITKRVLQSHAVFAESEVSLLEGAANLRTGIRLNHLPKLQRTIPEPRVAFNWRFSNNLSLEILGEYKNQTTSQVVDFQNDFLGIEKRKWALSNDIDIPVVTSRQVSAGLQFEKGTILLSLEGYLKTVNGIVSSSQGFQNQFQFRRAAGSYQSFGTDFLASYRYEKKSVWLGYSIAKNDYEFPEFIPPEFSNNLDIRHTISGGFNFDFRKFQFAAGSNWHSGTPFTPAESVVGGDIIYDLPNTARLNDYFRIDVSAKYRFKVSNVRGLLGISIWNILDKENVTGYYYTLNSLGQPERISRLALGFTPNAVLRFNFP